MLAPSNDPRRRTVEREEKRRASVRRAVRAARAREDAGLALATVIYDGQVLNLLVRRGYLRDGATDKQLISAAFSKFLCDLARE